MVAPEDIYDVECEVYCPVRAWAPTVNDDTVPRLKSKIVAGAANNQCLTVEHGERLRKRGIVYAPDFVLNAGGIINVSVELEPAGYNEERAAAKVNNIYNAVKAILDSADRENMSTNHAAIQLAEQKLAAGRKAKADKA